MSEDNKEREGESSEHVNSVSSNKSSIRSRRNVMKLAAGSGVSAIAFTGLASADTKSEQVGANSPAEETVNPNSSAEEVVEIGPNDDIGHTGNVEVTAGTTPRLGVSDGTLSPSSHGSCKTIGDTWEAPIVGVDVGLEITFCPECDITFEMTVLNQSTHHSVKACGGEYRQCEGSTLSAEVVEISTQECYYYNDNLERTRVEMTGEICGISLRHGWVCDTIERTYYEPL